MPTSEAIRNALNPHAYHGRPPRSATATGMIVATAMPSNATSTIVAMMPTESRRYGPEKTPSGRPGSDGAAVVGRSSAVALTRPG
jgi:hypothetical protein